MGNKNRVIDELKPDGMDMKDVSYSNKSRINRRSFLRAVVGTTIGAIALGLSSCGSKNNGNESIDNYLRNQYQTADLNQVKPYTFRWAIENHRKFIEEYMPYVNIKNPSKRDEAFISQFDINVIKSYMTIDPTNFTEQQKNDLAEFNALILTENDRKYISSIPWTNPKKLTDKDKVWLIQNARATAESYQLYR